MRFLIKLVQLPSSILLGAVSLMALIFSPFRLGRMLRTVSVPRMREHRLRTTFTMLGVALGVAVLVAVILVSRSIVTNVTATVGDLAGQADLQIAATSSGFDESVLDKIRQVPGIYKSTPVLQQNAAVRTKDGRRERVLVLGVDLLGSDDKYFRNYQSNELDAIRRDPLQFLNSSRNIILGRQLAQRLGLRLHDQVAISTSSGLQSFEVWGFVDGTGLGSAFGGAVAIMYYPAMQVAFDRGRNIDRIDLAVTPGHDQSQVAKALKAILGESFNVEPPASRGERVAKMLMAVRTALGLSSVLALVAGAFLVINTMGISVMQRKRELGILRALGAKRGDLIKLLTLEGTVLGIVGAALGVVLALGVSRGALALSGDMVNEVYMEQAAQDVELDPSVLAFGFALGIACATISALIATGRAGKIKPTEALSSSTLQVIGLGRASLRSDLTGGGLLAATVVLMQIPAVDNVPYAAIAATVTLTLGGRALMPRVVEFVHWVMSVLRARFLSVEAAIAADNLPRDVGRTTSTASGLMTGVSLTVGVGTFIISFVTSLNNWSGQLLPGDLMVTSGSSTVALSGRNTPMADTMRAELAAIPGVEKLRSTMFLDIEFRGLPVKLVGGSNPRLSKFTYLEGTREEVLPAVERGEVTLSENLARRFDLHRGDVIPLSTKDGTREFKVAGVLIDYTNDRGAIALHRNTMIKYWGDDRVDAYELFLKPGVDAAQVRKLVNERLGDKHDLVVLTTAEFRGEFVKAADKIFSLMHVLEVVTLLVALLGMVTALLANVLDRVREVGVLRALGMRRTQVRKMVMIESTLVGAVGTIGGVLVGLGIGYIMLRHVLGAQIGWHLPYQFPLASVANMLLITLPIAALAGYYPARQAANLVVREALDFE